MSIDGNEPDRTPKWQRRPEQRRREILDAARSAFGCFGYQRATLSEVAERAGVCSGTVSHYFGSKSELFEALIADQFIGFVEREEAAVASFTGPMRDLLHVILRDIWEHAWTPGRLELMQVLLVEADEFPAAGQLFCRQLGHRWRGIFGRILETGMANGEFKALDPNVASRVVLYSLLGTAQKMAVVGKFDPEMPDRDLVLQGLTDMIDCYVAAPTPAIAQRAAATHETSKRRKVST
ncbi:MAG: TetR/AcrR family transcriptional regulator [Gemmatimonadales bacterium]|nr:TetR/AcrR family transcriptional regulator [Gemmatimonadales bacterium]